MAWDLMAGVRVQRRGVATRLASNVIATAPQSIGIQKSVKIEQTKATMGIMGLDVVVAVEKMQKPGAESTGRACCGGGAVVAVRRIPSKHDDTGGPGITRALWRIPVLTGSALLSS